MPPFQNSIVNDLSDFLDYMNHPMNEKKLRLLSVKEKELLYYFERLSIKDQGDILDFIKIKANKTK
jgi:hypothetical protein